MRMESQERLFLRYSLLRRYRNLEKLNHHTHQYSKVCSPHSPRKLYIVCLAHQSPIHLFHPLYGIFCFENSNSFVPTSKPQCLTNQVVPTMSIPPIPPSASTRTSASAIQESTRKLAHLTLASCKHHAVRASFRIHDQRNACAVPQLKDDGTRQAQRSARAPLPMLAC